MAAPVLESTAYNAPEAASKEPRLSSVPFDSVVMGCPLTSSDTLIEVGPDSGRVAMSWARAEDRFARMSAETPLSRRHFIMGAGGLAVLANNPFNCIW